MIPYDDLVIALQTWRAKQGLPVGQLSGQLTPPPAPAAKVPSGPTFSNAAPPPLQHATHDEPIDDVDGHLIEEQHDENYNAEAGDFAMGFQPAGNDESTSIGGQPSPEENLGTEVASPGGRRGGSGQQDW
ncbi:MAG TPA: hypothetical protein VGM90_23150 [Kofleriaceae bacterium]|jgi:hypothetical protein